MRTAPASPEPAAPEAEPGNLRRKARAGRISGVLGAAAIVIGATVLAGWFLDSRWLTQWIMVLPPMTPATALAMLLAGTALLLLREEARPWAVTWAGRIAAAGAAALGIAKLYRYLEGPFGLERLILVSDTPLLPIPYPDFAAPTTIAGLLLTGAGLVTLEGRGRSVTATRDIAALGTAFAGLQGLIGHAYTAPPFVAPDPEITMALPSAVALLCLAVGLLLARPAEGFAAVVTAGGAGGYAARRLLPTALLIPFGLGLVRLLAVEVGVFGPTYGLTLAVTSGTMLVVVIAWWVAFTVHQVDVNRRAAEAARERAMRRERWVRRRAEATARTEEALRRAAQAVAASYSVEDVAALVVENAQPATRADGAFIERLLDGGEQVVVVAVGGRRVPPAGEAVRVERSATGFVRRAGGVSTLPGDGWTGGEEPAELRRRCEGCPTLVVPLENAGGAAGALVLIRDPERKPFTAREVDRAVTFGDLASLAFRKVQLLEESRRREADLQRVLESRSILMRGFSHDLKNPLGAADGQLALLEAGVVQELTDGQRESVLRARRSLDSALRLIDSLVQFARVESGHIEIAAAPVDIGALVRELVEEYGPDAVGRGLRLTMTARGPVDPVTSDHDRIRQILGNLLSNALKYTPSGGSVNIDLEERWMAAGEAPAAGAGVDVARVPAARAGAGGEWDVPETPNHQDAGDAPASTHRGGDARAFPDGGVEAGPGGGSRGGAGEGEGGPDQRWICVHVSDTGPGIPEDRLQDVFGEFVRLDAGDTRGAGLGLAISRRLARLLHGDITVSSEPGRGSTFTLWLPAEPPATGEARIPGD